MEIKNELGRSSWIINAGHNGCTRMAIDIEWWFNFEIYIEKKLKSKHYDNSLKSSLILLWNIQMKFGNRFKYYYKMDSIDNFKKEILLAIYSIEENEIYFFSLNLQYMKCKVVNYFLYYNIIRSCSTYDVIEWKIEKNWNGVEEINSISALLNHDFQKLCDGQTFNSIEKKHFVVRMENEILGLEFKEFIDCKCSYSFSIFDRNEFQIINLK